MKQLNFEESFRHTMVINQLNDCIQKKMFITILQGRVINRRKTVHSVQHNLLPRTTILMSTPRGNINLYKGY